MPALDLWPLLQSLTIRTKSGKMHQLRRDEPFAWAQREFVSEVERQYNAGEPVRIIVLKGRQLGLSTVTEAILFIWCFLHPGTNALVLSKEREGAEYLFGMTKRYWELGPFKGLFPEKYNRQGYLEWDGIQSSFFSSTASKEDVGRGKTLQAVHCSEVAFWPDADDIAAPLGEAIPYEHGTIEILESTANGIGGYFHDEWQKAIDPTGERSTFVPMFFPWWEHDEYEVTNTTLTYRDLEESERDLLEAYPKLTIPKLAWRRRKLTTYTNPDTFKEEYPMSMEEAFLATGSNVFDLAKLAQCYKAPGTLDTTGKVTETQGQLFNDNGKLAWRDTDLGHWWVYRQPDPHRRRRYVVGCDPSQTVGGDPACIQILDRASMEQVAVWHGSADPQTVGEIALAGAMWYGPETILNTEVQGGGRKTLEVWRDANWAHIAMDWRPDRPRKTMGSLCWNTTFETKNWLVSTLKALIVRRTLILHHPATYYEMTHWIQDPKTQEFMPSRRSGHDDTVMALGVAVMTVLQESGNLDWTASMAPMPAYVPGMTKPTFVNQGNGLNPILLGKLAPAYAVDDGYDDYLGIESTY